MMRRLFDLSLQTKIPLRGAVLIITSILSVSSVLMYLAYSDMKAALITSSKGLGHTLSTTLVPSLLHDDVWRAFEIVRTPFTGSASTNNVRPDTILVISPEQKIFVSSDPLKFPMLSDISSYSDVFQASSILNFSDSQTETSVLEPADSEFLYVRVPIKDGGLHLGTLVLRHSRSGLNETFLDAAVQGVMLGLLVLAVLLPISWYWGQRMALPLMTLASRMENIRNHPPEHLETEIYAYDDELGRMFAAYNTMVEVLQEKAALEKEVISSERLAAVGRLTASIAHEINNPLSGMLTALDTLKKRGGLDERTVRTLSLVERGLLQICDTVGALLVEARPQKRWVEKCDFEDVRTLLQHKISKSRVQFDFMVDIPDRLPFPAGAVRQILINLLHNAIESAEKQPDGWVRSSVILHEDALELRVSNNCETIASERLEHLFEPFVSFRAGGHGLGLWVTYQLVDQLGARIDVHNQTEQLEFIVHLPLLPVCRKEDYR